jgi:bifunctional DNA-binding transcriptional regulator/antitoxin component of YhaV-PrlF toxin-antitoxin module
MNIVKLSSSGQVTLPKKLREEFDTDTFAYERVDGGILFYPVNVEKMSTKRTQKKYSMDEFKAWSFESKNSKETNLAGKIDSIVYGLE